MGYWDYEEPYWEPSEADILFDDVKNKLLDAVKSSIKADMEALKTRNEYLKQRNKELEQHARNLATKERELQYKAENIEREIERKFYEKAVDNILSKAVEESCVYFAQNTPHSRPKCDLCNDKRELVHTWPSGKTVSTRCECSDSDYWFEPAEAVITTLKYSMRHSRYQSERCYAVNTYYKPFGADGYDDYDYREFKITYVVDEFTEETKNLHNDLGWRNHIGFKTQEECQKYCDWLNEKREDDV